MFPYNNRIDSLGVFDILSEFHGSKESCTKGKMVDIMGLPPAEDL
jgi:hypothetical protein